MDPTRSSLEDNQQPLLHGKNAEVSSSASQNNENIHSQQLQIVEDDQILVCGNVNISNKFRSTDNSNNSCNTATVLATGANANNVKSKIPSSSSNGNGNGGKNNNNNIAQSSSSTVPQHVNDGTNNKKKSSRPKKKVNIVCQPGDDQKNSENSNKDSSSVVCLSSNNSSGLQQIYQKSSQVYHVYQSSHEHQQQQQPQQQYKLYRRRFLMILFFALAQLVTSSLVSTCSPIGSQLQYAYGLDSPFQVNLVAQIYLITHPLMTFPSSLLIDRLGTHIGLIIGCTFVLVGVWLRTILNFRFFFVIIGQFVAGIGRPLIANSQGKVAAAWFPAESRTTVTALFSLIITGSVVLGILFPGIIFNNYSKEADVDRSQGQALGERLMFLEAIIASALILPAIFFFRNQPPSPPSKSAGMHRQNTSESMQNIKKNRNYKLLLLVGSLQLGCFNAAGSLVNYLISPYYKDTMQISIIGAAPIFSGLLSVVFINPIIKKYHCYKLLSCICLTGSMLTYAFINLFLEHSFALAIVAQLIVGIFLLSATPIILEFAVELTYPVGEQLSVGLIFACAQLSGALISFMLGFLAKGKKSQSHITFLIMAGIFLIGLVIMFFIEEDLKRLKFETENLKQTIKKSILLRLSEKQQLKLSVNDNDNGGEIQQQQQQQPQDQQPQEIFVQEENLDEIIEKEVKSYLKHGSIIKNQNLSQKLSII